MALTWIGSEICSLVRKLAARPDTDQLSDGDILNKINDYYQNVFPLLVDVPLLRGWHSQETAVNDSGKYTIAASVLRLKEPMMINGEQIQFHQDETRFFSEYPRTDGGTAFNITAPSLAIGSSNKAHVANSAFKYDIDGHSYSKSAVETALSGDSVPQNKYGAWRLDVDSDGTISITAADNNSTGYATPAFAVDGLASESSSEACMGFVIVVNTSGSFVPGTTELDATGVSTTYADGKYSDRNRPLDALIGGDGYLYLRPKPDDIYLFEAPKVIKPDALTESTAPLDVRWGPVIAYGTAIQIKTEHGEATEDVKVSVYKGYLDTLNLNTLIQTTRNKRALPRC